MIETQNATHQKKRIDSALEIELAINRNEVTFPMVMKALYLQWPRWEEDKDLADRYSELYQLALSKFVSNHGGISASFYADEFAAGALITIRMSCSLMSGGTSSSSKLRQHARSMQI